MSRNLNVSLMMEKDKKMKKKIPHEILDCEIF